MEIMHDGWTAEVSDERGKGLTLSEAKALIRLASGMTQKEIAKSVALSPRTVRGSLERAYYRLGVTKAAAAVSVAQARGWIRYAGKVAVCGLLALSLATGTNDAMRRRSQPHRLTKREVEVQMYGC
ncbi:MULTISPECIES: LuxR C-terminal-related transcriptional regulator [unclassified Halomonas]|uniref:helix-turn-helix transcriptional regulator n=1 Tax=unclassified Halomonas TaxID=2609666 RepID=UPI0020769736|nr:MULTISPECIES: LuxR C-terminal-related transcriptional regulator [unclassified Halomonas]